MTSTRNLFLAWDIFVRGKRSKIDVQIFARHLEDNLFALQQQINTGQYRHDPYKAFVVHDPKRREIHKSTVKDRVVHQAIVNAIEPLFERRFMFDSFSSRKGKGTHVGVLRLQRFLREESRNDRVQTYAVKCDIRKFFASVDQSILLRLLRRVVRDERACALLDQIVASFQATSGIGIPLGNVTSQLFANVYLNELDQFVKHKLRVRRYVRFCDDFVCVSRNRSLLEHYVFQMDTFVQQILKCRLHEDKTILRTYRQGVDFLGYVLFPHGIVPRASTKQRVFRKINAANAESYAGYLSHAKSWRARQQLRNDLWLNQKLPFE